jgi:serine/threonine-protein kinase
VSISRGIDYERELGMIAPGTKFDSYEVREAIGSGGMGDVYRATDTELKRDVAVKVLPESFAADADRLARFRREAEVLAALNHPNVAQIFGLEKADGRIVIVMELVDGPTLAERIASGPLPADEALGIARQVAAALEAAHERQIVHRDLKPANVKLKPDGTVKVLDFGIAKTVDVRAASAGRTPVAATPAATETGVILGTAAYMSPEQARGKPVDQRTDIWAFGCLLFEMLTGQPAFGGEDVMLTLARVLDRDTDLSSMPGTLSPAVRQTIKLCLEKDPRRRIADIRDVRLALDGAFDAGSFRARQATHAAIWWRPLPVALTALALGAAVVWIASQRSEPTPSERPLRLRVAAPATVGPDLSGAAGFSLSPDGRYLAIAGTEGARSDTRTRLWIWSLDSLDAALVPGTEGARRPFWSPDGRTIGFAAGGEVKRVDASGGPVQTLLKGGIIAGGAWGTADVIVFINAESGLSAVPAVGGEARVLTRVPVTGRVSHDELPVFLPDGRHFLYFRHDVSRPTSGIYVGSIDLSPEEQAGTPLVLADDGPRFFAHPRAAHGYVLFQRQLTLYAQAFDLDALALTGKAVPIETDLVPGGGFGLFTTSADGDLLVYQPQSVSGTGLSELVWVDHAGREEPLGLDAGRYQQLVLSPDGAGVVIRRVDDVGVGTLWVWSVPGRTLTRLVPGSTLEGGAYWTHDGQRIVFVDATGLASRRADGAGATERLADGVLLASDETADGALIVTAINTGGDADIAILPLTGERKLSPLLATDYLEGGAVLSPDGRWLAYQSNESGRFEIYVRPFPDVDTRRWQVSTDGGELPKWARDGSAFYFIGPSQMMRVAVEEAPTFSWQAPEAVLEHGAYSLGTRGLSSGSSGYGLSPDGQRFLFVKPVATAAVGDAAAELVLVQDWLGELERRLAAD